MTKFFQVEKAAYAGQKDTFRNVEFKKGNLENSSAAEAGTILEIIPIHYKNPPVIQFIAYVDSLKDDFQAQFTPEQPFGRTDPYYMWKSNRRTISVTFSIPSSSEATALDNLNNLSWFAASMYPTYKDAATATSVAASPMFRVRFSNLICSSTKDGQGLLGIIKRLGVTHDAKQGFIGMKAENMNSSFANGAGKLLKEAGFANSINEGKKFLVPKLMKVTFSIDVVHDHALGWDFHTGNWRGGSTGPRFPYDFGLTRDIQDTPSAGSATFNDTPDSPQAKEAEKVLDDAFNSDGGQGITPSLNPGEKSLPASEQ